MIEEEGAIAALWAEASEGMDATDDVFIAEIEYDLEED